ncbi:T-complex protein 1 subunit theta [Wickerhamiella sorbophila]|uniref:T-complex protein 1 subunit theta n=1 Tax=Wickerhamiella sorbophila TaxID=45607 RepID=A0A2T0FFJ1_9ASCO|nr:T-complex protein 1 subunit theta [Wickerhamiella sorbophila]PRT53737.1 T-complex protein 1 subunit theta [Wickerhamiella sorbophila]
MSSLKLPSAPNAGLFKQGYTSHQSEDGIVHRNIQAVREIASMVRTSVGPSGRNKIVVNHLQKIFLTSDAGTILRELDIVHPVVKVIVMASQQQEAEMGDASNLVVVLAGELLNQAEELVRIGMSTAEIVQGYELALKYALEALDKQQLTEIDDIADRKQLARILQPVIAAKQHGIEDLLAEHVADAVSYVLPKDPKKFNVDNVRVVKIMGSSIESSMVIKGMVFNSEPEGSVKRATNAKVAVFTCPVDISQTETKGTVLLHNAKEMLDFSKGEETQVEDMVKELVENSGVKVIIAGGGIGALALHYLNRYGVLVFKVGSKFDLQRLCRVTGAAPIPRLGAPTADELGLIDLIETEEIGGDRVTVFKQEDTTTRTATIVLRGATQNMLDDVERAVDDGVNAVKALTKNSSVVPGAGASEIDIAEAVVAQGERTSGTLQYAIKKFGLAFEVIPRTLAENAGLDTVEVISKLYALHSRGVPAGVDINFEDTAAKTGTLNTKENGIFDIYLAKRSAIELATTAACTVLNVDQIIMAKRAGGPQIPQQRADWDQD